MNKIETEIYNICDEYFKEKHKDKFIYEINVLFESVKENIDFETFNKIVEITLGRKLLNKILYN